MIPNAEKWDRRFSEQPWPTDPDPYLVELADGLPPGRGLDLGSGPGRNSLWLAARGWDMTLLDASVVALEQAAVRADEHHSTITTIHADVLSGEPDESAYDLVVVANLHPGREALPAVLTHAVRALRPGGHLYVVGHHLANLGRHGPPDADRLFTTDRLFEALPSGLTVEIIEIRDRAFIEQRLQDADTVGQALPHDGQLSEEPVQDGDEHDLVVLVWATRTSGAPRAS